MPAVRKPSTSPVAALLDDPDKIKDLPVETMERLFELQQRHEANEAKKSFHAAMMAFKQECPKIVKRRAVHQSERKGGGLLYKFADLDDVQHTIATIERKHGFSHTFDSEPLESGGTIVICVVSHIEGHEKLARVPIRTTKGVNTSAAQDSGIEVTFGQRRALLLAYGLTPVGEDRDGIIPTDEGYERISESQAADLDNSLVDGLAALPPR